MFQRPNQDPESSPDGYGNCYGLPVPPVPSLGGTAFLELSSAAVGARARVRACGRVHVDALVANGCPSYFA